MGSVPYEDVPPEPGPPRDLRAEAAGLVDQANALLADLRRQPGNDRLVSELVMAGVRFGQLATALEDSAAGQAAVAAAFAAGSVHGEALATARTKVPKARHAAQRSWGLKVVQGIAIAGVALKPLGAFAKHPVQHLAAASLPVKVTAAGVVVGTAAVGAVAIPQVPAVVHSVLGGTGEANTPSDGTYSATPVTGTSPSQRLIATVVTKPKVDARSAGKLTLTQVTPSSLPSLTGPSGTGSSAPWPADPQPVQAAPGDPAPPPGPAALTVSTSALDLSAAPSVTVTITASGSGWATWRVDKGGSDLDFSKTSGVLAAGQSATVTITADTVQDGALIQVFSVAGQPVTVTLPIPVPVPTVSPTDVLPSDVPTVLPSGN